MALRIAHAMFNGNGDRNQYGFYQSKCFVHDYNAMLDYTFTLKIDVFYSTIQSQKVLPTWVTSSIRI